ncbi:hypothetical protein FRUB_05444 [Fimbriiglobus ruber]|uniref:Uncharacterized protein n=1 Tax=Fimbriiglobus ruber TaxID=1908690 RepID=A0A225DW37_9BACT|nr:hypothetical protein FRUB_05444 [Fimbriiglobus ruber]
MGTKLTANPRIDVLRGPSERVKDSPAISRPASPGLHATDGPRATRVRGQLPARESFGEVSRDNRAKTSEFVLGRFFVCIMGKTPQEVMTWRPNRVS